MKRKVYSDGNGSDQVLIEGMGPYVPLKDYVTLRADVEHLKAHIADMQDFCLTSGEVDEIKAQAVIGFAKAAFDESLKKRKGLFMIITFAEQYNARAKDGTQ